MFRQRGFSSQKRDSYTFKCLPEKANILQCTKNASTSSNTRPQIARGLGIPDVLGHVRVNILNLNSVGWSIFVISRHILYAFTKPCKNQTEQSEHVSELGHVGKPMVFFVIEL